MSTVGGSGPASAIRGGRREREPSLIRDARAQRKANSSAPPIPHLLRRVSGLFRPHRRALIVTVVLVFVGAALSVFPPLLTEQAFDVGLFPPSGKPNIGVLIELVSLMVLAWVASAVLGVWQSYLTASVGNRVMGGLRVSLFEHLQKMEIGFFTRTKTGAIQSRLANDVGGVSNVVTNTVSNALGNAVTVIAALVAMLILSWQLTVVAIFLMPALAFAQRRVGQVRARIATVTQESLSDMTAITQEALSVSGILLTKSFNRQQVEVSRYAEENRNQIRLQVRQQMSGQWFFALVTIFLSIIPAIVFVVAGYLVAGGVNVTAGTIVAFTTVQARLMWPLLGLMRVALDFQTSGSLFARIFEYLDLVPAIEDSPTASIINPDDSRLGRVEFDDVVFRYPDQKATAKPTLERVSFVIEPGQVAAFVGTSGAGKTTVSYLIPRFYDVAEGSVRFAGVDVRDLQQKSLLAHVGIVSQETYLFHASIAENLRYARPDASLAQLVVAARSANIHATIESFPDGYDTLVGERGYRLSGGEKQRIAIARVLLKDPEVLILDEATSALDSVSESVVQEALDDASRGRTTIAIAHRLSTIVNADVIFVVDRGRIAERGTHTELLAARGAYADLYRKEAGERA